MDPCLKHLTSHAALDTSFIQILGFLAQTVASPTLLPKCWVNFLELSNIVSKNGDSRKGPGFGSLLFSSIGGDVDVHSALPEFETMLDNDGDLGFFLQTLDIRKEQAMCLFRLLDKDSSGEIDMTEFVHGLDRLQGAVN